MRFVPGYPSGNLAQPILILLGSGEVNEQCVLSCFPCLPSHFVFIYLRMEILAFLVGRAEKQLLVSLGNCAQIIPFKHEPQPGSFSLNKTSLTLPPARTRCWKWALRSKHLKNKDAPGVGIPEGGAWKGIHGRDAYG
jgi:hypothetical protein